MICQLTLSDNLDRLEEGNSVKHQVAGLLHASRFMRGSPLVTSLVLFVWRSSRGKDFENLHRSPLAYAVPLIGVNLVIVLIELILG
jgi:hypothetical protein